MNKLIDDFEKDVIDRMSRSYYEELLYFTETVPDALLNFNDVLLLKKGQKYVSHTNTLFQKSLASLFLLLYKNNDKVCSICKTDGGKGRGVYVKEAKKRIHFLGQEKFVGFPRVNWINMKDGNNNCIDIYTVMIKKNHKGIKFIDEANKIIKQKNITTKRFILLEDFVIEEFDDKIWRSIENSMTAIEVKVKDYQWFGLINYYNELTKSQYINVVEKKLIEFDYKNRLLSYSNPIAYKDIKVLQNEFINKCGYKMLLEDNDFCSSFITSEWLFDNLNMSGLLEKTYIVTGYIKSIEQLMTYIVRQSKIGITESSSIKNVDVQSHEFINETLGNLLYYLKSYSNRYIYINQISNAAIKKSIDIIREWIKVERNGYFHKHNIQDINRVKEIREKTLILYFLLIASINVE